VHVSVEQPAALGTAGAVGQLCDWVDGRAAVVTNADAWIEGGLAGLLDGWDGRRVRLLVTPDADRADFGRDLRFAGASVMPWDVVRRLRPEPSGLYEVCWRALEAAGELDFCLASGRFIDCGTPADYLAANLAVSGGQSVVGEGAVVEGELLRSVVWPGGVVRKSERLVDAIRVGAELTVDGKASTA
jgi:NDP-sugar pyrophosphorylase family protein